MEKEDEPKIEYDFDDPTTFEEEKFSLVKWFKGLKPLYKGVSVGIAVFLLADLLFCIVWFGLRNRSSLILQSVNGKGSKNLIALNAAAKSGVIESSDYANFKFSKEQQALFSDVFEKNGTVALTIRLKIIPTKSQQSNLSSSDVFHFGFLTQEDFDEKDKFIDNKYLSVHRLLIQGEEHNAPETIDISFALKKSDIVSGKLPKGFFVYSAVKCKILAACVVPAQVGFDVASAVPFFGYACNGGKIDYSASSFDFTASSMVFPVQNSMTNTMPELIIKLDASEDLISTVDKSVHTALSFGGERYNIKLVKNGPEVSIPAGALKTPFARVNVVENQSAVKSIIMNSAKKSPGNEIITPIRSDPGLILNYKSDMWRTRDYEIFEWDRFSKILFFDTRDYKVQDKFFMRLAYFVEKEGFKGRLMTNEQLEGRHGYNAHDYSAVSMAAFFNKAVEQKFKLNYEEELLKRILIQNGLFTEDGDHVIANEGGIVSISQQSESWLRTNLLAHEGWHTIFFRDEEFRNFVSAVYYTMDPKSLEFLIEYFKSQPQLGYDVNDDYLMHNEFMAYIMQQKLKEVGTYFVHLANRGTVIKHAPNLAAYIRSNGGEGFEDAAIILNDYVFDTYGIVCGNIALVNR